MADQGEEAIARTDAFSKLYQVRKTLIELLKDRGYVLPQNVTEIGRQDFVDKYQLESREDLFIIAKKPGGDDNDQIFVFFPEESKVGVGPIRKYLNQMRDEGISKAIIVVQEGITPMSKQALVALQPKFEVEVFHEAELLVNITRHVLVPKHSVMSEDDKKALLSKYKLRETQLPRMQLNDPVARYYGLRRGQVVKIMRDSETAGRYVTYRLVM